MAYPWRLGLRKVHRWGSIAIALPFLVVILTGILLQLKKQIPWVQPVTLRGEGKEPRISLDEILEAAKSSSQAEIEGWNDVERIDIQPKRCLAKLISKNSWEVQIDLSDGSVLQTAYRRSDWIEALHDGSGFHEQAKLWIFLPSALVVLVLWVTGIYLFILPWSVRRAKKKKRAAFSLIELIVALAIVGVLAALLFPALTSARESARRAHCSNQLHQIGLRTAVTGHGVAFPIIAKQVHHWPIESSNLDGSPTVPMFRCPTDRSDNQWKTAHGRRWFISSYGGCQGNGQSNGIYGRPLQRVLDGKSQTLELGEIGYDRKEEPPLWETTPLVSSRFKINSFQAFEGVFSFGSHHPAGLNSLFLDGSIHFLSEKIDHTILQALSTVDGGELESIEFH